MKRNLIRYKTKPENTAENRALIENVFRELHSSAPEGFRYVALALADGSFVHLVENSHGESPLLRLDAFKSFQHGIRDRCLEPPLLNEASIVGNYRMLGER